jgi:C1A family cysteine protease
MTTAKQTKRGFGWVPDLPDHRDAVHRVLLSMAALPAQVDLRKGCSPIEDQGALGSCTAQAIASALEYLDKRADGHYTNRSRLFIYYAEREIEGSVPYDAGAMLRDGIKACRSVGAPREVLWPYAVGKFAQKPAKAAYDDAATEQRKISSYARVEELPSLLATLAQGYPVVFGFTVFEQFMSDAVARTGLVAMPGPHDAVMGGHAVMAVGYDLPRERVLVRNSWGRSWALKGYFWMPFAYVADRGLSDDFWVIRV